MCFWHQETVKVLFKCYHRTNVVIDGKNWVASAIHKVFVEIVLNPFADKV